MVDAFVIREEKLGIVLSSQDRACAEYWGSDEVMQRCLILATDLGVSSLGSLKPWMSNEHLTLLADGGPECPLHLCRTGSEHARQHLDVGGPDERRGGEEKGKAAYKQIRKEIPHCCLGAEMKKLCKYIWPSDFKDTDHESGAKGRKVTSNERTQGHLQMAKAKEQDFSKAGAI